MGWVDRGEREEECREGGKRVMKRRPKGGEKRGFLRETKGVGEEASWM